MTIDTFTDNGTWTSPVEGVVGGTAIVTCYGPAGSAAEGTSGVIGGGGGGGGACSIKTVTIARNTGYAIVCVAGGDTTFATTTVKAKKGGNASGSTKGTGGAAGSGTGDTKYSGGNGADGTALGAGGGGGGGAGTTGNGGNASGATGGAAGTGLNGAIGGDGGAANEPTSDEGGAGNGPGGAPGGSGTGAQIGPVPAPENGWVTVEYTAAIPVVTDNAVTIPLNTPLDPNVTLSGPVPEDGVGQITITDGTKEIVDFFLTCNATACTTLEFQNALTDEVLYTLEDGIAASATVFAVHSIYCADGVKISGGAASSTISGIFHTRDV